MNDIDSDDLLQIRFNFEDGDFDLPQPGIVRGAEWREVLAVVKVIEYYLDNQSKTYPAPSGEMHREWLEWLALLNKFLETKTLDDLLTSINHGIRLYVSYEGDESMLGGYLEVLTASAQSALSPHLEVTKGELSAKNIEQILWMLSHPRLIGKFDPTDEDEPWPAGSAGVFVVDPVKTVEFLMATDWSIAYTLVGVFPDRNEYFRRYTSEGRGLPILKEKYAANTALIHAKFDELRAWIDREKQKSDDED